MERHSKADPSPAPQIDRGRGPPCGLLDDLADVAGSDGVAKVSEGQA